MLRQHGWENCDNEIIQKISNEEMQNKQSMGGQNNEPQKGITHHENIERHTKQTRTRKRKYIEQENIEIKENESRAGNTASRNHSSAKPLNRRTHMTL